MCQYERLTRSPPARAGQNVRCQALTPLPARDHLGSIRELTDASATVRARYDYDPYGRRTKLSGDLEADFAFTGHYYHAPSALHLTLYRAYDAEFGRWLSRDPMESITGEMPELVDGPNLYSYVGNNPVSLIDPDGLNFVFNLMQRIGASPAGQWSGRQAAAGGRAAQRAGQQGLQAARNLLSKPCPPFSEYGAERALQRGFTPERIVRVLREGTSRSAQGRFGPQTRTTLGENTVVINNDGRYAGQIQNTFSTNLAQNGYWVEP